MTENWIVLLISSLFVSHEKCAIYNSKMKNSSHVSGSNFQWNERRREWTLWNSCGSFCCAPLMDNFKWKCARHYSTKWIIKTLQKLKSTFASAFNNEIQEAIPLQRGNSSLWIILSVIEYERTVDGVIDRIL